MEQEFYREENFKDTEIGRIPEEWEVVRLGDKKMTDGLYYGITAKATAENTRIKMLRTTDIKDYSTDWETLPFCKITDKRNDLDKYFLRKGDLIVARAGTVGVSVLVDRDFNDTIFGSYLIKVKLKPTVNPKFIHYFFQSALYWKHLQGAQGSTLKNINLPLLKSLRIPLPPLHEQQKIAHVLKSLDEAIQAIEDSISKLERLKKGLMQELLTKGIGHKNFKNTEIGRIPEEWKVVRLGKCTEIIMGQSPPGNAYNTAEKGLPLINGPAEFGERYPNITKWTTKKTKTSKKDDLLICVRGHTTGRLNISDREYCIGRGVAAIRGINGLTNNMFLYYILEKLRDKIYRIAYAAGSTFPNITRVQLNNFLIPLPPLHEQQKIAEILSTLDELIQTKREKKVRMEKIKKAVMNKLLTGEIRIKSKGGVNDTIRGES